MKEIITPCLDKLEKGKIYSKAQIVARLKECEIDEKSIPNITSMTYNRWNKGMKNEHLNPLFEHISRNKYRFLGANYPYTGELYNKPKGGGVAFKIGYWLNGYLFDYENQLSNYKFDISVLKNEAPVNSDFNAKKYLIDDIGFTETGKYIKNPHKVEIIIESNNVRISERAFLVYALCVGDNVLYLGKTVQGYIRPFSYHKYDVMDKVKEGIEQKVLTEKKEVCILTKKFEDNDFIEWKKLKLNIIEAVEQALILKLLPEWNKYKHR